MRNLLFLLPFLLSAMISCTPQSEKKSQESDVEVSSKGVAISPFGKLADGTEISMYTLSNGNGVTMKVINYGGIIVSVEVPSKDGKPTDVVLGFDSLDDYVKKNPFF